jgi:hypothetical protein
MKKWNVKVNLENPNWGFVARRKIFTDYTDIQLYPGIQGWV